MQPRLQNETEPVWLRFFSCRRRSDVTIDAAGELPMPGRALPGAAARRVRVRAVRTRVSFIVIIALMLGCYTPRLVDKELPLKPASLRGAFLQMPNPATAGER